VCRHTTAPASLDFIARIFHSSEGRRLSLHCLMQVVERFVCADDSAMDNDEAAADGAASDSVEAVGFSAR